jgi:hypothetical protein
VIVYCDQLLISSKQLLHNLLIDTARKPPTNQGQAEAHRAACPARCAPRRAAFSLV